MFQMSIPNKPYNQNTMILLNTNELLSIIIPVFNEDRTIELLLDKVGKAELFYGVGKELIIINDCSIDQSEVRIINFINNHPELNIVYQSHTKNQGKGCAIHTGIKLARGNFIIVQDADLEYDPREYNVLLRPMIEGYADVVYGSRFMGGNPHRIIFFWHTIGNKILTFLSNMFTNLNLTDMETCYKLFRAEIIKNITLEEKRFGFEPEVTSKIARIPNIRIYEVGISYYGRTYAEGKKIGWKDGVRAIYCIIKYGLFKRS